MGIGITVKTMVLVIVAVVLGMFTVQGSYALWNTTVPMNMGTVRAADFRVLLTGSNSAGTYDMVLADGSAATISLSSVAAPLDELSPGVSVYAGVDISNVTDSSSGLTVLAAVPDGTEAVDAGPGSGMADHLIVRAAPATSADECSSITEAVYLQPFAGVEVPQGSTAAICFRLELSAEAPSMLQGQSASLAIPLHVNQIRQE